MGETIDSTYIWMHHLSITLNIVSCKLTYRLALMLWRLQQTSRRLGQERVQGWWMQGRSGWHATPTLALGPSAAGRGQSKAVESPWVPVPHSARRQGSRSQPPLGKNSREPITDPALLPPCCLWGVGRPPRSPHSTAPQCQPPVELQEAVGFPAV